MIVEGQVIERALFRGRIVGGLIIIAFGLAVTPAAPGILLRALGVYFFAYAALMLALSRRATSARQQRRVAWLAHAFDTVGFLGALGLSATDPGWLAVNAAPLYVLVAVTHLGILGAVSALGALAATHLGLALWRDASLGIPFDLQRQLVQVGIYGLAALLVTALDSELRILRERALDEFEHRQRLDSLGALASGIAHDFGNVLGVILNDAHLALGAPDGGGAARPRLEEIRDTADQATRLTRQLLAFTRGVRPSASGPVDVRREATYAARLLRRAIRDDIRLDVRVPSELPGVRLEPGALEQILMNLVVNARDAMPSGGRVGVAIDEVTVGAEAVPPLGAGRYVRVVVDDEGIGMTEEVARRAFEPFFSTKGKGQGSGLGLSTVQRLVRRAGGDVGLASVPGMGTRVTIHLPAFASGRVAREPETSRSTVGVS